MGLRQKHQYALANCPGRLWTTVGGACLAAGSLAAATAGWGHLLLSGFGSASWLSSTHGLGAGTAIAAESLVLLYPALYGISIVAELWIPGGVSRWLGRRVRGSWGLFWSTLVASILVLSTWTAGGSSVLLALAVAFSLGGLGVRWTARREEPSVEPMSRVLPAAMFVMGGLALTLSALNGVAQWHVPGLVIAGALGVGALALLVGSAQDLYHQRRRAPREIISKEGLYQALRMP